MQCQTGFHSRFFCLGNRTGNGHPGTRWHPYLIGVKKWTYVSMRFMHGYNKCRCVDILYLHTYNRSLSLSISLSEQVLKCDPSHQNQDKLSRFFSNLSVMYPFQRVKSLLWNDKFYCPTMSCSTITGVEQWVKHMVQVFEYNSAKKSIYS